MNVTTRAPRAAANFRRRGLLLTPIVVLLVGAVVLLLLPSRAQITPAPHWVANGAPVRGAYHVHSVQSDGTGTADDIAAAAARAGMQFVIFTDHGDATRTPEAPAYRHGVLCIDGVEVNTNDGHYVALGMPASPYPLAGTAAAVAEDVARLGGFGIAAHPGSPRTSLQWTAWQVPVDGMEWLNADSEWRDELWGSLGRLLLTYPFRPAETLTALLDRPVAVMARWDTLGASRRVVAIAGTDAHARFGLRQQSDPYEERPHLNLPGYESVFRAFSTHVTLDAPLSGDAVRDSRDLLNTLRQGRAFTIVDGIGTPGGFEFTATSGGRSAPMGGYLDIAGDVSLHVRMAAPPGTTMVVMRDGVALFDTRDVEAHVNVGAAPGVYRMEARIPGTPGRRPIPWLVSNPIYIGLRAQHARRATPKSLAPSGTAPIATEVWVAEASPGSTSALTPDRLIDGARTIEWAFSLTPGHPAGQYAAVRFPAQQGLAGFDRLQLRARADAPRRVWAQLRASTPGAGERWGRSFYLAPSLQSTELFFKDFIPLGATSSALPPLERVDSILLVIDTVNTRPGTTGAVAIADLWLGRP